MPPQTCAPPSLSSLPKMTYTVTYRCFQRVTGLDNPTLLVGLQTRHPLEVLGKYISIYVNARRANKNLFALSLSCWEPNFNSRSFGMAPRFSMTRMLFLAMVAIRGSPSGFHASMHGTGLRSPGSKEEESLYGCQRTGPLPGAISTPPLLSRCIII